MMIVIELKGAKSIGKRVRTLPSKPSKKLRKIKKPVKRDLLRKKSRRKAFSTSSRILDPLKPTKLKMKKMKRKQRKNFSWMLIWVS